MDKTTWDNVGNRQDNMKMDINMWPQVTQTKIQKQTSVNCDEPSVP
jgi:hypothetical protein